MTSRTSKLPAPENRTVVVTLPKPAAPKRSARQAAKRVIREIAATDGGAVEIPPIME